MVSIVALPKHQERSHGPKLSRARRQRCQCLVERLSINIVSQRDRDIPDRRLGRKIVIAPQ